MRFLHAPRPPTVPSAPRPWHPCAVHPAARHATPLAAALLACQPGGATSSEADASSGGASTGASSTGTATAATDATTDGSSGAPTTGGAQDGCWTDLAVGETQVFYKGFADGSEGVAFGVDGLLYVTARTDVWRLDAMGQATVFATMPSPLGLAPLADGGFIVASIGANKAPDGAVYRLAADGTPTILASGIDDPNFVTILPDGSALVSDDFDTRVFHVTLDGQVTTALNVDSPNGMAYSPDGARLYVASTFTQDAQLTRYDVDAAGLPIEASALEILHLGPGATPDGIAVSEDDHVYVAANLAGEIWRVPGASDGLQAGERVAEMPYPASLAFGRGPGFDPCSLYVTQLLDDGVIRVAVGVRGAPLYM